MTVVLRRGDRDFDSWIDDAALVLDRDFHVPAPSESEFDRAPLIGSESDRDRISGNVADARSADDHSRRRQTKELRLSGRIAGSRLMASLRRKRRNVDVDRGVRDRSVVVITDDDGDA